jgi:hypothetical protein
MAAGNQKSMYRIPGSAHNRLFSRGRMAYVGGPNACEPRRIRLGPNRTS